MSLVIIMNVLKRFKVRKMYKAKIKQLPDENLSILVNETIKLYPETIDISDGQVRGKKGFWSRNLADARLNAENLNISASKETDYMIWAIYGELHTKSIELFRMGLKSVYVLDLNRNEIIKRYIKAYLEAEIHS